MGSNRLHGEENFEKQTEHGYSLLNDRWGADPNLRLIHLFNHYRHDWMNEIQLVFAYVKLKKYDRLEALMENIKIKVQHESHISKLGHPELIVYLFSSQAGDNELKLEIEMEQEIHLDKLLTVGEQFSQVLMKIIDSFKKVAKQYRDSEHALLIKLAQTSSVLKLDCIYHGELTDDQLMPGLEQIKLQMGSYMNWKTNQRDENLIKLGVEVPLNI